MLKKTEIISLIITFSLWVSFVLVAIFVPIETKKTEENFVSVKITLPPLPEKQEQKKEVATTETPVVEEKQVPEVEKTPVAKAASEAPKVEKVVEEPKKQAQKKTEPSTTKAPETKKSEKKASQPVKQELVQSVEDAMANQQSSTKSVDDVDWDALFGTSSDSSSSSTDQKKVASSNDGISGSAATSTSDSNTSFVASSVTSQTSSSSNTEAALNSMPQKRVYEVNTEIDKTVLDDGTVEFRLENGERRRFLSDGELDLPENVKIESSIDLVISFTILKEGTVSYSSIKISNQSLVPSSVITSLKDQISQWRFESAISDGQASLTYSIILK